MPHNVEPGQKVKIVTIEIAVPADMDEGALADGISALLTESGICAQDTPEGGTGIKPWVLDWRYVDQGMPDIVVASDDPEEGEIFEGKRA